ncbi:MAG TPA: hypothetical protein VGM56_00490 [Byssovorax sp.]|jgi:hypothetical protein
MAGRESGTKKRVTGRAEPQLQLYRHDVILQAADLGLGFQPQLPIPKPFLLEAVAAYVSCPAPQEAVLLLNLAGAETATIPIVLSRQGTLAGFTHYAAWQLFPWSDILGHIGALSSYGIQFTRSAGDGIATANVTLWGMGVPDPNEEKPRKKRRR